MTRAGRASQPFIDGADPFHETRRPGCCCPVSRHPGRVHPSSTRQAAVTQHLEDVMNVPLPALSPSWLPDLTGLAVRWTVFRHRLTGRQRCACWICGDANRASRP